MNLIKDLEAVLAVLDEVAAMIVTSDPVDAIFDKHHESVELVEKLIGEYSAEQQAKTPQW